MDWNRRASSNWGFAQSVNTGGGSRSGWNFSVDLKLGQSINGEKENGGIGKSSKRARGGGNANQPTACLVDGCASDLRNSREYHRRHKVCELHSKTPQVSIGGQKQRFCQQCSRFHCLEEFDEGKRSCRKRLDVHNRRRRTPQPETVPGSADIFSNYHGAELLSFSSSHDHHWSNMGIRDLSESDYLADNFLHERKLLLGSASYLNRYKQGKRLTFQAQASQSLLDTVAITESCEDGTLNLNDAFSTPVRESDGALSLLSSSQTQTPRSSISLLHQCPFGAN